MTLGKIELTPAFTAFDDTPQFDEDDKDFTLQFSHWSLAKKSMKTSFAHFRAIETMRSPPDYNNENIFHALAKTPKRKKKLETIDGLNLSKNPKVTENESNCCSDVNSNVSKTTFLKFTNDSNNEAIYESKHNNFSKQCVVQLCTLRISSQITPLALWSFALSLSHWGCGFKEHKKVRCMLDNCMIFKTSAYETENLKMLHNIFFIRFTIVISNHFRFLHMDFKVQHIYNDTICLIGKIFVLV